VLLIEDHDGNAKIHYGAAILNKLATAVVKILHHNPPWLSHGQYLTTLSIISKLASRTQFKTLN